MRVLFFLVEDLRKRNSLHVMDIGVCFECMHGTVHACLVRKREFRIGVDGFGRKGFKIGLMEWGMEIVHFNCIIYLPK